MNFPNTLTLIRIFFVPILVAVLVQERITLHGTGVIVTHALIAMGIGWIGAATALLEGSLARRWGTGHYYRDLNGSNCG